MTGRFTTFACAALCAATLASTVTPAGAGPSTVGALTSSATAGGSNLVEKVQYRGRGNRGGYRGGRSGGNFGRNAALGIGAAIIGGIVLSEAARAEHRRDHGAAWERCAQTYRSFEPSTGLYTGYDGVRRTCPYLS